MALHDFNPNFKSKHIAPTAGNDGTSDFPMEAVIARLDGEELDTHDSQMSKEELAAMMREIFVWMTTAKACDQRAVKSVGLRAIAAAWVLNPGLFGDAPSHMVAKSFWVYPKGFNTRAADFSRKFGIKNQFQAHDWQNK